MSPRSPPPGACLGVLCAELRARGCDWAAVELLFADCDPYAAQRAVDLLVPQASGHGRGVVEAAAWERSVSHYIVCSDDRAMSPALQMRMAKRCSSHEVLNASHSPYISQPHRIAAAVPRSAAVR